MTTQTNFTPEEWHIVRKTLHEPGAAVIMASPDGALREFMAIAQAVSEAAELFRESELVQSLLKSLSDDRESEMRKDLEAGSFMDQMIRHLRQSIKILEAKAKPDEVESYKQLVTFIAEKIARVGNPSITTNEQQVLDEIQLALQRKV